MCRDNGNRAFFTGKSPVTERQFMLVLVGVLFGFSLLGATVIAIVDTLANIDDPPRWHSRGFIIGGPEIGNYGRDPRWLAESVCVLVAFTISGRTLILHYLSDRGQRWRWFLF